MSPAIINLCLQFRVISADWIAILPSHQSVNKVSDL